MINRLVPGRGIFCADQLWRFQVMLCGLVLPLVAAAEVFTARVTAVPDGDTLWVQPTHGGATRKLRLQGIDAPEICQSGGATSRAALQAMVAGTDVRVELKYYDDYGRGLARIHVGQQDIGALMVRSGQAWSYRWHHSLGPYATEETAARRAKAGLFAEATPEQPRDFRKRHGSCYPP
jgi:endonuclease YncB( thermonuclease family)